MTHSTILITASAPARVAGFIGEASQWDGTAMELDLADTDLRNDLEAHVVRTEIENRAQAFDHLTVFITNVNTVSALELRTARNFIAKLSADQPDTDIKCLWVVDPSVGSTESPALDLDTVYVNLAPLLSE